tara:strand:- start:3 stop:185 length:183 start_codon:yes stop_codon:yes gene_type:complete
VDIKKKVLITVDDLVSSFLYCDRKEDEDLENGAIESAIENGDITVDEIVAKFKASIIKAL